MRLWTSTPRLDDRTLPAAFDWAAPLVSSFAGLPPIDAGESPAVAFAPDEKIVIALTTTTAGDADVLVLRLNSDGTPDTSFNGTGTAQVAFNRGGTNADRAVAVAVDSAGRVVVVATVDGGAANPTDVGVLRLTAAGQLDTGFSGDGKAVESFDLVTLGGDRAADVAVDAADRVYVLSNVAVAAPDGQDFAVTRFTAAGEPDPAFGTGGRAFSTFATGPNRDEAAALALDAVGRVIVGGTISLGGNANMGLVAFTPAGAVDAAFGRRAIAFDRVSSGADRLADLTIDSQNRIIAAGEAEVSAGNADFALLRLLPNGQLDTGFSGIGQALVAFDAVTGGDDRVVSVRVDAEGRVVALGTVETAGGFRLGVARLGADGKRDAGFGTNGAVAFGDALPNFSAAAEAFVTAERRVEALLDGFGPAFAAGSGPGQTATATLFDAAGKEPFTVAPFGSGYTGGLTAAAGDVNRDGAVDLVVGAGAGGPPRVVAFDGRTRRVIADYVAFEAGFTRGVFVAAGDVDGDGFADLLASPDRGGGPRVQVRSGADGTTLADFFGISDTKFRGGARMAVADVTGDGVGDILVGAGFGGGPRVAVFDGSKLAPSGGPEAWKPYADFFLFEPTLRDGVFLTGGDISGDGFAEIVAGGGPGGGPRVFALDGKAKASGATTAVANFFAGSPQSRGGVRVGVTDIDADGVADLVTGSGTKQAGTVRLFRGPDLGDAAPEEALNLPVFGGFTGGVFVG